MNVLFDNLGLYGDAFLVTIELFVIAAIVRWSSGRSSPRCG